MFIANGWLVGNSMRSCLCKKCRSSPLLLLQQPAARIALVLNLRRAAARTAAMPPPPGLLASDSHIYYPVS